LINKAAKTILKVVHLKNIYFLEGCSKELVTALFNLRSGQRTLLKVQLNGDLSQLVLQATEFILHEQKYTLVSIQNIQSELEEKEIESWHRLIRVLTHEIMNSVTPISSLASTASDMLIKNSTGNGSKSLDPVIVEDVLCAVKTIENRSQGLLHFVESYRKLLRIPKPRFKIFTVESLFQRVEQLLSPQLTTQKIKINRKVEPETLELTADPEQIEQVLINLILNSIQALAGKQDPRIEMLANQDKRGRIILSVIDNGVGIPKEVYDKIFVPFFTTKKNGTGIGLSLSQQIMRLHKGTISVQSKPDEQTVVSLKF
jgi:signal transduction histidine kinase